MNKQEALKRIEAQKETIIELTGWAVFRYIGALIEQLDEPQPVKVPQFVSDWIEEKRDMGWKLAQMLLQAGLNEQYGRWVVDNQELFARAWLDGYEVEEEKRYTVRIKGVVENSAYLKHQLQNNHWYYGNLTECSLFSPYHTKKELEEADFGWVFDCPGIEIEEVE